MLDAVSAVALLVMFALSVMYVRGCDRLKGERS